MSADQRPYRQVQTIKEKAMQTPHFGPCPTCKGTGDGPPCAGQHGCDHGLGMCNAPACRSCEGQGEVNQ